MLVKVAHDFTCPWCYIGWQQARRLQAEFGVEVEWLSCELWPDELELPVSTPKVLRPGEPRTPTRLELAYIASDVAKPAHFCDDDRIHRALEATEYARSVGQVDAMVDRLYRALWNEGRDINDVGVIQELAAGIVPDPGQMARDIEARTFRDRIVPFDETAYATGVYYVPTFFIGDRSFAEQPYPVLARAVRAVLT